MSRNAIHQKQAVAVGNSNRLNPLVRRDEHGVKWCGICQRPINEHLISGKWAYCPEEKK